MQTFTRAGGDGDYITSCVVEACRGGICDIDVYATAAKQVYKKTSRHNAGEGGCLCCQHGVGAQLSDRSQMRAAAHRTPVEMHTATVSMLIAQQTLPEAMLSTCTT